jgi:hypothetical protein
MNFEQKIGNRVSRQSLVVAEIVTPAERYDAPLSFKAVKLEFLERKVRDPVQQAAFVFRRYHVHTIEETRRKRRIDRHRKEARLNSCHEGPERAFTLKMGRMQVRLHFRANSGWATPQISSSADEMELGMPNFPAGVCFCRRRPNGMMRC